MANRASARRLLTLMAAALVAAGILASGRARGRLRGRSVRRLRRHLHLPVGERGGALLDDLQAQGRRGSELRVLRRHLGQLPAGSQPGLERRRQRHASLRRRLHLLRHGQLHVQQAGVGSSVPHLGQPAARGGSVDHERDRLVRDRRSSLLGRADRERRGSEDVDRRLRDAAAGRDPRRDRRPSLRHAHDRRLVCVRGRGAGRRGAGRDQELHARRAGSADGRPGLPILRSRSASTGGRR